MNTPRVSFCKSITINYRHHRDVCIKSDDYSVEEVEVVASLMSKSIWDIVLALSALLIAIVDN